ncbi:MAG: hypothetical protein AB7F59_15230 [Bdellovibrionales bacterium]
MILDQMAGFGVLSTRQISKMFFEGVAKTTLLRRLRILEEDNLIRRAIGLAEGELAWTLTTDGLKRIGSTLPPKYLNRNSLEHDILLNELRLSLNRIGLVENWIAEHVLKAKRIGAKHNFDEPKAVPDGLLATIIKNRAVSVAIELEIQPKSKIRYEKILQRYYHMKTIFAVWYFVRSKSLGEMIFEMYEKASSHRSIKPQLIWSLVDDSINDPYNMQLLHQPKPMLVRDVFQLRAQKSAHTVAQGMSRQAILFSTHSPTVSVRDPDKNLPART